LQKQSAWVIVVATVLRINGLRVVIYSNDHRPPHVHVLGPNAEAVFQLSQVHEPKLVSSFGFSGAKLNFVAEQLNAHAAWLFEAWAAIHGTGK
jgi:hypothetical protein